jgi:hypothetical protein
MLKRQRFVGALLLCWGPAAALAAGIPPPPDPEIAMDVLSFSDPVSLGYRMIPVNGGGIFGFFNDLGATLTRIEIDTFARPDLDPLLVAGAFHCAQPIAYFHNCTIGYTAGTGLVSIVFSGVDPPGAGNQFEAPGFFFGVPPVPPQCAIDTPECAGIGHFAINLNDGDSRGAPSGGWSVERSPELFATDPVLVVTDLQTVPEPATFALFTLPLALMALRASKVRRRLVPPTPQG